MNKELATTKLQPVEPSPFRRALNLISSSPKSREREEEEEKPGNEAEEEGEEEEQSTLEEEGGGPERAGQAAFSLMGHFSAESDALAQLMANFAQQNGGQLPAGLLPPLGQPIPDFPAALLAHCPPPHFGPFPPGPFQNGPMPAHGPMPAFPFPLDPSALAAIQPFMIPPEQRRKNATREVTAPLKHWLNEHRKNPYPTKAEKTMLAVITRMTMTQVSTWFANARRRLKKENKMTWSPRNKPNEEDEEGEEGESGEGEMHPGGMGLHPNGPSASSSPAGGGQAEEKRGERKRRAIWSIEDTLAQENGQGTGEEAEEKEGHHSGRVPPHQPPAPSVLGLSNGHQLPPPPPPEGLFPPDPGFHPQMALGLGLPPCADPNFLFALASQQQNGLRGPRFLPLNPFMLLAQQLALAQSAAIKPGDPTGIAENGPVPVPVHSLPLPLPLRPPSPSPQIAAGQKRTASKSEPSLDGIPLVKRQCRTQS